MFVFTFVAGLFTFQYDKPHFDPLPTVATEQGKDAHRFPCHVKVIFFVMSEILSQFFLFVSDVPPVSIIVENPCHAGHLGG